MKRPQYKIAIGIVDNHPSLIKSFAKSLISVLSTFQQWAFKQEDREYILDVLLGENGGVDDMRNAVANQAVREKYDALFWMDSDMVFPPDCLIRMLQYLLKDDYEAVSGLYTYKDPPFMPHVYGRKMPGTRKFEIASGFPLNRPFKIEGAGFGCLLMKVNVFNRLKVPYFTMKFKDGKMIMGEDLSFCAKADMRMILDPKISCGHIKQRAYGIGDYIGSNGLAIVDDWIKCTKEQKDIIIKKMDKNKK